MIPIGRQTLVSPPCACASACCRAGISQAQECYHHLLQCPGEAYLLCHGSLNSNSAHSEWLGHSIKAWPPCYYPHYLQPLVFDTGNRLFLLSDQIIGPCLSHQWHKHNVLQHRIRHRGSCDAQTYTLQSEQRHGTIVFYPLWPIWQNQAYGILDGWGNCLRCAYLDEQTRTCRAQRLQQHAKVDLA